LTDHFSLIGRWYVVIKDSKKKEEKEYQREQGKEEDPRSRNGREEKQSCSNAEKGHVVSKM